MTICTQCSGTKGTQGLEDVLQESTGGANVIPGVGAVPCSACNGHWTTGPTGSRRGKLPENSAPKTA